MRLYLEQQFPLGRFHASRWKQGSFGDSYGEWPPSPWRLLRALTFRWFQWSRETGNVDISRRNKLLNDMARFKPSFYLPASTKKGYPIKQYLPIELAWTDPKKDAPAYKKTKVTLNEDHYRILPSNQSIYWAWPEIDELDTELLDELLRRILYFGRAESWNRICRIDNLPDDIGPLCVLEQEDKGGMVPVLCPVPGQEIDFDSLLLPTENFKNHQIPPGTMWRYTKLPKPPVFQQPYNYTKHLPEGLTLLQFAVGGHVLPNVRDTVTVINRFRGRVLRQRFKQLTGKEKVDYGTLTNEEKADVSLLSGKDPNGQPLRNHPHASFFLLPGSKDTPIRLVVWRSIPFTEMEVKAFMMAAEIRKGIVWDYNAPQWNLRIIPLPFDTIRPLPFKQENSYVWESVTPFVPPISRRRFRKNGKERPGETPEKIVEKLCNNILPQSRLNHIETLDINNQWTNCKDLAKNTQRKISWVSVHRSLKSRERKVTPHERNIAPGYHMRLFFDEPVYGPIALGESSHFGLGLFTPVIENGEVMNDI